MLSNFLLLPPSRWNEAGGGGEETGETEGGWNISISSSEMCRGLHVPREKCMEFIMVHCDPEKLKLLKCY